MTQTVLVTGATGFIAKHIILGLLDRGHTVVGSLRSMARGDEVRDAVRPHLRDPENLDARLRFVSLDLESDTGWVPALSGVDVLMHTASPVPIQQPKDPQDIIRPTVSGTKIAMQSAKAAGITRVILTSSLYAVSAGVPPGNGHSYTEADWTDTKAPGNLPYDTAKTLAERAAWDFVATKAPEIALTTLNPGLVMGPPLDAHYGTSLEVIARMLRGNDPMLANLAFNLVDVRDVAEAHIRAMERPETAGERLILAESCLWMAEIATHLRKAFPKSRVARFVAPNFAVRIAALFDPVARTALSRLGRNETADGSKARDLLDLTYIDAETSLRETGQAILAIGAKA